MKNNIIDFQTYYYQKDEYQKLKELAASSYNELIHSNFKGISILDPLPEEVTKDLVYILKYYQELYKNMSVFTINDDNKERIVLRRIIPGYYNINTKLLEEKADIAYRQGNNEEAGYMYYQILQGYDEPQAYVYLRLGLLFNDFPLDYLIVAAGLANDKEKENYLKILDEVRNKKEEYNYNIDNLDEILDYIENSDLNVEESCLCLGLDREQTDIIKLKMARIYFTNKHYNKGDEFIRAVESTPGKTDNVKNLLNEVVANKKIYSNDYNDSTKKLSLKLKPGKHI